MDEEGDIADGPNGPIIFQGGRWVPYGGTPTPSGPRALTPARQREASPQTPAQAEMDQLRVDEARRKASQAQVTGGVDTGVEQSRAAGFYGRARMANENYAALGVGPRSLAGQFAQDNLSGLDNSYWIDPQHRQAKVWQDDFISATLRYESGAAVPPAELEQSRRRYFPMPGDDAATLAAKAESRRNAISGLEVSGGAASPVAYERMKAADGAGGEQAGGVAGAREGTEIGAAVPSAGSEGPASAGAMNEELVNTAQAPARVKRLSDDQAGQVLQAAQSGDVGRTMALLEQFTGFPASRAAITKAVADYRQHPEAGIKLSYDDAGLDEFNRYGTHRQEARKSRQGSAMDSGVRQAANAASLGIADPLSALMNTVTGSGEGDGFGARLSDNMKRERALTNADFTENPGAAYTGMVLGSLALPTRAPQMAEAERAATIAGGGSLREAARAGRAVSGAQFGREGLVYGGVQGAANNIENPGEALKQGGLGAVTGGVFGNGLGRSMGAAVRPEARVLMDEGIRPTMGQMTGGNLQRLEDVIASAPVAGATTNRAQQRAVLDLNRAAINRVLRPIGETLPRNVALGTEAVEHATQRVGQVYERELPNIAGSMPQNFAQRLAAIARRTQNRVAGTDGERNVRAAVMEALRPFNRTGNFTGRAWKDADETLGGLVTSWAKSDDPYVRASADAADAIRDQLRRVVYRQNPQSAALLRAADRGYANLIRVQEAAKLASNEGGIFTANQLNQGVRTADQSIRKNAVGRGTALMQDLSAPAAMTLRNKAGQGGSKDMNALLALGAVGSRSLVGDPVALGVGGLLGANKLLYSRPGQAAMRSLLAGSGAQRGMRAAYQTPGAVESDIEDYMSPKRGPYNIQIGGPK